ncbi:calcium-binding protein [Streptomyces sp. 891-h]|nr:calcium-binding protein [Streptomyces sp. 891-h]
MRMRATAAAVSGALALSALAIPAALAAEAPAKDAGAAVSAAHDADVRKAVSTQREAAPFGMRATAPDDGYGDTTVSGVVVNSGKDVVLGTTKTKTVTVSYKVTDDSGVAWSDSVLWHGSSVDDIDTGVLANEAEATCTVTSATTATCKQTFTIDPQVDLFNAAAGTWKVSVVAQGNDADWVDRDVAKTFAMKRYSKLTVNASPEPVKKGRTITISGYLSRANWDTSKYAGYTKQTVKLQSRPMSGGSYATLKSYTTGSGSSAGKVKTTRTAGKDTCWRYSFAGTSTTPSVTSKGDCVDVR